MPFTQADRPLRVHTPLGPDKLLIVRLQGTEAICQLFRFELELLAENITLVEFDKLIGQPIAVEIDLPDRKRRHFHGLCSRLSEGRRDATFTRFRMEIVPQFWLLTRRTQCRIFQQKDIPTILKEALAGLDVKWDLKGQYNPRDYCVQYRETDFAFASRLMEEEGIYYYFTHSSKGHQMVVADTPQGHVEAPEFPRAIFDDTRGGNRPDLRVIEWEKSQELRSGKVTLWDHCFELPGNNLEAQRVIPEAVSVGKVTHKLSLAGNTSLELFDYPGAYAQRYDGIDPGGGDRTGDLQKIFQDNARTAKIRMEQEAAEALVVRGASNCSQFTAGHQFTLERHHNGDGLYVLTEVKHDARMAADYRSGGESMEYFNHFACLPAALPYRPPFRTPEPEIRGPQTATVVGPPGELIHCDRYGRVKVKFHWDRVPGTDDSSSCWVRVSQNWGGAKWGGLFIPHAGQEVIVEFEEGDPDRPLITGRVYNAAAMPPGDLPADKTKSIIRDHGGNQIIMEGHDGVQQIKMYSPYAETEFIMGAPHSPGDGFFGRTLHFMEWVIGKNWNQTVRGHKFEVIALNETSTVSGSRIHTTTGNFVQTVIGGMEQIVTISLYENVTGWHTTGVSSDRTITVGGDHHETITGKVTQIYHNDHKLDVHGESKITITKDQTTKITGASDTTVEGKYYTKVTGLIDISSKASVELTAKQNVLIESETTEVTVQCGSSRIEMKHDGTINITGKKITLSGEEIQINGTKFMNVVAGKVDIDGGSKAFIHASRIDLN